MGSNCRGLKQKVAPVQGRFWGHGKCTNPRSGVQSRPGQADFQPLTRSPAAGISLLLIVMRRVLSFRLGFILILEDLVRAFGNINILFGGRRQS